MNSIFARGINWINIKMKEKEKIFYQHDKMVIVILYYMSQNEQGLVEKYETIKFPKVTSKR